MISSKLSNILKNNFFDMNRDFNLNIYKKLIKTFLQYGYSVIIFEDFFNLRKNNGNFIIIRHDIDKKPQNALKMAQIENGLGIYTSYYFRTVKKTFKEEIIREIAGLGNEIGYHYEDFSRIKGDYKKAIESFKSNIDKLRQIFPVKTICMHGSPLSKYDNRELWNMYDYRDYGIIGEPYFDIDFNEVLYLTDTGRAWNTSGGNVRDKVKSKYNYNFQSTFDIIKALEKNELPDKIMFNIHPQRWNDNWFSWKKELVWQNIKNIMKKTFFKRKST